MTDIIQFENRFETDGKYTQLIEVINETLPEINRATALFNKTQSHFMDNMLTVSHVTPIRNLRQILAEIKRTRLALGEAYYGIKKSEVSIEEKREQKPGLTHIQQRRIDIEIEELEWKITTIKENAEGAIRKLANYSRQYQEIQTAYNLHNFTEEDFEQEEERYHICKAFEQGLNAARAHQGYIDEGNQIYFSQIGINGTVAQVMVTNYLNREASMLSTGIEPGHDMQIDFLLSMADKFKGCSTRYGEWKGMSIDSIPLH